MLANLLGLTWLKAALAGIAALAIGAVIVHHVVTKRAERERQVEQAFKLGETTERALWIAARAEEQQRQREINEKAVAAATAEVARLRAQNLTLEKAMEALRNESDKDPDRDLRILDPNSLLQLNRIR